MILFILLIIIQSILKYFCLKYIYKTTKIMKNIPLVVVLLMIACQPKVMKEKTDHIILAVNDLSKGIQQFKELTGVEPVFGGVHPNSFTQNALVALDKGSYLEIIAPRTDIDSIPDWIKKLDKLTPYGWAVTTFDIEKTQKMLTNGGFKTTMPVSGSRKTSSGTMLSWTTFRLDDKDSSIYPFFIKWGSDTVHPSLSAPIGCNLSVIHIHSVDKDLSDFKRILNLDFQIKQDSLPKLVFKIDTPKGNVTFKDE